MNTVVAPFIDGHGVVVSPNIPGEDLLSLDADGIARIFTSKNLVLLRDFAVSTSSFKTFSDRMCAEFMTYEAGASARGIVNGDRTLMTVSEPSHRFAIPLHGEMYYAKNPPRILWFYCARPAAEGGETTVADGAAICERLSAGARALFEKNRIRYICTYPDGRWQDAFGANSLSDVQQYCDVNDLQFRWNEADHSVTTEYISNALGYGQFDQKRVFINNILTMTRWESHGHRLRIVRFEGGSPIPEPVIFELQQLEAEMTMPVSWRIGDVLMVDNTRYLHGRRAFSDTDREIYVRLSGELKSRPA